MTEVRGKRLSGPIVLVGLSGAGKTAVGRLLATRLDWAFLDLDAEVERLAGRDIAAIFADGGEVAFRSLEAEVTAAAGLAPGTVIATGGGWMARPELRDRWPAGVRIWLQVEPGAAVARLGADRAARPLLRGAEPVESVETMLAARLPSYALSEYTVRTDGREPDELVEEILARLPCAEGHS